MKARAILAFSMALSALATVALGADLKPVFEGRYAQMKAAMAAHDAKAVSALLAPGFVSLELSGKTETTDEMLAAIAALPADPNKVSQTTVLSASVQGNAAAIEQRYDMKTIKTGADGTKSNVELVTLSSDSWIKAGDAWLLQKSVTKQIDYYVNGTSVLHKTAAP